MSANIENIKPLPGLVLVSVIKKKKIGSIMIPESFQKDDSAVEGKVLAVGEEKIRKDGSVEKMHVQVGDYVYFKNYAATVLPLDEYPQDEKLKIVAASDILIVLKSK